MSNVRVSNGSPSLERMDARQAEYPKPSACRNLFGPVNHEELTRDLEKHCRDMEEASQRKWNFDFQNHKPLEGKYEWQEVEKGNLPEFYYRPPRPPKGACKVPAQEGQDASGARPAVPLLGSQANPEDTHLVDQKTDAPDSQTGLAEQCPGIRKRPAADDSSPQNKRANRTEENVSDGSPNAGSVEQTPKKPGLRRRQTRQMSKSDLLNFDLAPFSPTEKHLLVNIASSENTGNRKPSLIRIFRDCVLGVQGQKEVDARRARHVHRNAAPKVIVSVLRPFCVKSLNVSLRF
ncbi:hypothetical protein MJG53_004126 [Ovis ammon polii x Ovis aries]|uniref:Uncharacterized protein n=1 Tax=Ovis ammon polii x Ovis aries TaxID=2918886 RepID=A0ACB9V8R9_9CETA|nr:hypothetical protein MJG53_004126 [Ovis ammon polii x Ovis aries]